MTMPTNSQPRAIDPATVKGWGIDADPRNDPTYPYRLRTEGGRIMDWERPPLQSPQVEVLRSIEHNRLPAVFGTSTPPRGVSGAIRRVAFGYSENDWRHWLMLLGADRVNVLEGVLEDLARGRVPNIPAEMGLRAEWQHNKRGLARKVAVAAAISGVAVALWRRGKTQEHKGGRPPAQPSRAPSTRRREAGGEDVFVQISAVERAGLRELRERQRVSFDIERDGRSGKAAAANLRLAD